jgi:hypothetical protein
MPWSARAISARDRPGVTCQWWRSPCACSLGFDLALCSRLCHSCGGERGSPRRQAAKVAAPRSLTSRCVSLPVYHGMTKSMRYALTHIVPILRARPPILAKAALRRTRAGVSLTSVCAWDAWSRAAIRKHDRYTAMCVCDGVCASCGCGRVVVWSCGRVVWSCGRVRVCACAHVRVWSYGRWSYGRMVVRCMRSCSCDRVCECVCVGVEAVVWWCGGVVKPWCSGVVVWLCV